MYIGFVAYVVVISTIALAITSKTFRTIAIGAIIFALVLGAVILPLHGAAAEAEQIPEICIVNSFDNIEAEDGLLRLDFEWDGEILSLYWEGSFDPGRPVWVSVYNNEVMDADYVYVD